MTAAEKIAAAGFAFAVYQPSDGLKLRGWVVGGLGTQQRSYLNVVAGPSNSSRVKPTRALCFASCKSLADHISSDPSKTDDGSIHEPVLYDSLHRIPCQKQPRYAKGSE
ncbi:hypothetical protein F5Y19DRAFT_474321 [Xylariaceae sp. FL1651]|nr:hypothetical protein F5Y19DRAFT_474321 [Xylariaceae sp. FL1651]